MSLSSCAWSLHSLYFLGGLCGLGRERLRVKQGEDREPASRDGIGEKGEVRAGGGGGGRERARRILCCRDLRGCRKDRRRGSEERACEMVDMGRSRSGSVVVEGGESVRGRFVTR